MPIGAPGWPELALRVASTCNSQLQISICSLALLSKVPRKSFGSIGIGVGQKTYREQSDGVDGAPVIVTVSHDCEFLIDEV